MNEITLHKDDKCNMWYALHYGICAQTFATRREALAYLDGVTTSYNVRKTATLLQRLRWWVGL